MHTKSKNLLKITALLIFVFIQNPTVYAKASFSSDTGVLSISRIDASDLGTFAVDMKLINPSELIFEVQGIVGESEGDFDAHFDKSSGMLHIPVVEVIDENGKKSGVNADLLLVEGTQPIQFKIYSAEPSIESARKLYNAIASHTLTTDGGKEISGFNFSYSLGYQDDFAYLLSGNLQVNTFELSLIFSSIKAETVNADIFIRYASDEKYILSDLLNPEKAIKIASILIPVKSGSFEYKGVVEGTVPKTELGDRLVLLLTKDGGQGNPNDQLSFVSLIDGKSALILNMN